MALGNSQILYCEQQIADIKAKTNYGKSTEDGLYSCWNTFQYVTNNLSLWASDTVIGANIQSDLKNLVNIIEKMMITFNKLTGNLESFLEQQKQINGDYNSFVEQAGGVSHYVPDEGSKICYVPPGT